MKFKFLVLLMLLLFPFRVLAQEQIEIECKKEKEIYECKLSGNIDYEVSAIDFHFSLPSYASVKSYEIDSRWEGSADNNWVSLYSEVNSKDKFPLVTLQIESKKSIKESSFKITDLIIFDEYFVEHKVNEKNVDNHKKKILISIICVILIIGTIVICIKKKGKSK